MKKRMSWITGALVCLMTLFAALGTVCAAAERIAQDETFYGAQSRQAVMDAHGFATQDDVTAYIGMDEAQQQSAAGELAQFMAGGEPALSFLNDDERVHMQDVRALIRAMAEMSRTYFALAAALAVVAAWTGAKLQSRVKPFAAGALTAVTLIMLVVFAAVNQISAGGFERMFVQMHEMLFDNDLWRMDPQTDVLIRMMPQNLFELALLNGANQALRLLLVVLLMLTALYALFTGMIRRHLNRGDRP